MRNVSVSKDGMLILDHVDLDAADGELVAIIGPSGAGKSTLLRVAAGLDKPDTGEVRMDGEPVPEDVSRRNIAMVFQNAVLYPRRDVAGNVAFPLEMQHRDSSEIDQRVLAEVRALHLADLMDRDPHQLSAGHQQLVQIARALVRAPALFLMDEPLARLDAQLRTEMRTELRVVQRGYGVTTLYVTNDPVEAMAMADRLVVLVAGRVVQSGPPTDVYGSPATLGVAQLTGALSTLLAGVSREGRAAWLEHEHFRQLVWSPALEDYDDLDVEVGFRPEQLEIGEAGTMPAVVIDVAHHGAYDLVTCRIGDDDVAVRSSPAPLAAGDEVRLAILGGHVFDPVDGRTVGSWA